MGPYPEPMAEVMADDTPGESKAVLDLGCGSGSWSECFSLFLSTSLGLA
jgi:predicted TPR repeat methyltransferase